MCSLMIGSPRMMTRSTSSAICGQISDQIFSRVGPGIRVTLAQHGCIAVVVNVDELRPPPDEHRQAAVQTDAHGDPNACGHDLCVPSGVALQSNAHTRGHIAAGGGVFEIGVAHGARMGRGDYSPFGGKALALNQAYRQRIASSV